MRVPFEILSLILCHAETQFTYPEMMKLRLVNCQSDSRSLHYGADLLKATFDREVRAMLFSDKHRSPTEDRFINHRNFHRAPENLQHLYYFHRLHQWPTEPSVFVSFFAPVLRQLFDDLGAAKDDPGLRQAAFEHI
jgi:hypothetical protein